MATKAYGRMVFWEGASLWVMGTRPGEGAYPKTGFHSHHAIQVTVALRGTITLESEHQEFRGGVVAVAPDTEHTFEADADGIVALLFIDPEGRLGRAVHNVLFADTDVVAIPSSRLGELPTLLRAAFENRRRNDQTLIDLGRALITLLAPGSERDERPEVRVRRMSAWAAERLDAPVSLTDAAAHVGLSSGRARHLFVEATGLPFRTYVVWLRLMRAVELYSAGSSLTDAAHGAGFSDSSHLSRTFRRMFGVSADSLRVM